MPRLTPALQKLIDEANAKMARGEIKPFNFKNGRATQFSIDSLAPGGTVAAGDDLANVKQLHSFCESASPADWAKFIEARRKASAKKIQLSQKALRRTMEIIAADMGIEVWRLGFGKVPEGEQLTEESHPLQYSLGNDAVKAPKQLNAAQARRLVDEQAKTCPTIRNNKK